MKETRKCHAGNTGSEILGFYNEVMFIFRIFSKLKTEYANRMGRKLNLLIITNTAENKTTITKLWRTGNTDLTRRRILA